MGLSNSAYGFSYAGVLVTMPQLMAAHGVGEPEIAGLVFLSGLASLMTFAVAPILDTLISRQAWARGLGIAVAGLTAILLGLPPTGSWVAPFMMADALALVMLTTALGGWLGAALPKDQDDTIGAWFTIGNGVGFGIGAFCQYQLISRLPAPAGQIMVGVIALAPILLQRLIPSPDLGRKAVRESFGDLVRDVSVLVRQPRVLRIAAMLALPCAAFTLTNAFGGLGRDFHASAEMVDFANGIGPTAVGMAAALLGRWCLRFVQAPVLYLGIGAVGAVFTVLIIGLPHTWLIYLIAVCGENIAQSIAQVAQNAITFGSIRRGSPTAATQFGLLTTAALLPYTYMLALDGWGYKLAGNVTGQFLMDAGVSLGACLLIAVPVLSWMRSGKLTTQDDEPANVGAAK